ncbi:3'-5' exonuclease [Lentisphaera profundi]|uniref:3'-5' exonuclease n=1 Tax=Lentisphaera profundi TaxID=1658616 RepID=A0ABY7VYU7_9BACT|nr:3'-5' exonuclease [Lentisphaera profundi]WDE98438.1 3'-5' exonuclease [Lentisphaera profundi]
MSFLSKIFPPNLQKSFPGEILDHNAAKLDYVVIDCEMTGLNPKKDHLLSVAAVKISNSTILLNDSFYKVIYQEPQTLRNETILIHRLNHEQISTGEDQVTVLDELASFCEGAIPVGHFFNIDLSFLSPLMDSPFSFPHLDTRNLAHYLLSKECPHSDPSSNLQLTKLCELYAIPYFEAHNALGDATATACLFLKLLGELRKHQHVSLESILSL